ncbi:Phax [Drosophila busckii]|uniref:Phosphorylated adapter RNA export protein n=1 Tax=Drosophila busckii TaxID=30019 RepID=A0A0M3QYU0_DROBS|nr:Phax [Drosophila busckii]
MDLQTNNDSALEDGELSSSDDIYTPLQRPVRLVKTFANPLARKDDESEFNTLSSSGESSEEDCIKKQRTETAPAEAKKTRKIMVRVSSDTDAHGARFRNYNVWTAALQEESLSENMRSCNLTRQVGNDRSVENYAFPQKHKKSLKRRLFDSPNESSALKRGRQFSCSNESAAQQAKTSVKQRLGQRVRRGNNFGKPRHILDLNDLNARDACDVASEMASKLYELKDELIVRVVQVLGIDLPLQLYKQTQRIEADGGIMIKNGNRRRTPGGVFLFLLKQHEQITPAQLKSIFSEDKTKSRKQQVAAFMRERKMEELKICLHEQMSLGSGKQRISNPTPSPEHEPQEKTHEINMRLVGNADEKRFD